MQLDKPNPNQCSKDQVAKGIISKYIPKEQTKYTQNQINTVRDSV